MNWIDDKYKEKLGNKKFPDGLKKKGWERAQLLLDEEFPVKGGASSGRLGLYLFIGAAAISLPLFWWMFSKNSEALPATEPVFENTNSPEITNKQPVAEPFSEENNISNISSQENESLDKPVTDNSFDESLNTNKFNDFVGSEAVEREDGGQRNNTSKSGSVSIEEGKSIASESKTSNANNKAAELINTANSQDEGTPSQKEGNAEFGAGNSELTEMTQEATVSNKTNSTSEEGNSGSDSSAEEGNEPEISDSKNQNSNNGDLPKTDELNKPNEENTEKNSGEIDELNASSTEELEDVGEKNNDSTKEDSGLSSVNDNTATEKPQSPALEEDKTLDKPGEEQGEFGNENKAKEETGELDNQQDNSEEGATPAADLSTSTSSKKLGHLAFLDDDLDNVSLDYLLFSRERFSISLWGGYSYVDKFLSASNQSYLDTRQNQETGIYTIPTGVNLDYFIDDHWTFGTGISWSEYGEDVNYDLSYVDTARIDGRFTSPSSFNDIVSIDSTRVIDSIFVGHWDYTVAHRVEDSVASQNNGRTTWQYVEIPFTIGYRFGTGRIKPWVRTGISIGIPTQTSFRYVNPQATELNEASLTSTLVAPIQYNYLLSVGLDCYLTRNISMRLNALGSLQMNSSLRQETIEQRYYRIGATLGIAYNF